jgi:hypothetical protein
LRRNEATREAHVEHVPSARQYGLHDLEAPQKGREHLSELLLGERSGQAGAGGRAGQTERD